MVYGIDKATKLHASKSSGKTYYYRFSMDTKFNLFKNVLNVTLPGTSHADELCYLFRCHLNPTLYDNVERDSVEFKTLKRITKLWVNFAKYSDPTPNENPANFKPVQNNEINFLDINNEGLTPGLNPHRKSVQFWNDLYQKYQSLLKKNSNEVKDEF